MKVLFCVPYPQGEAPSQRFRFEQYLSVLSQKGVTYDFCPFWDERSWHILYKPGKVFQKIAGFVRGVFRRLGLTFRFGSYDFIFIHREAMPLGPPVFEWLAYMLGKKIIYDFDDAIWLPNTSSENKLAGWLKWHSKVKSICRWSTVVSCGNEYLCSYARIYAKNVVLNPTTIDTERLHNPALYPKENHAGITIGWTGTHSTLKYLDFLEPILQSLEARFPNTFRFVVIANKEPELNLATLQFIPWSKASEIPDLLKFDIGVMPLTDDIWAKGKCGFKALQYMALEVPAIVSPVGVNTKIVAHGVTGFIASSSEEWLHALEQLLSNKLLQETMGKKSRQKIEAEFSVNSNTNNFLSLFK